MENEKRVKFPGKGLLPLKIISPPPALWANANSLKVIYMHVYCDHIIWATSSVFLAGVMPHLILPANQIHISAQSKPANQCFWLSMLLDSTTFTTPSWRLETNLVTGSWKFLLLLVCESEVFLHRLLSILCWATGRGAKRITVGVSFTVCCTQCDTESLISAEQELWHSLTDNLNGPGNKWMKTTLGILFH